jgi:hypothetical protein
MQIDSKGQVKPKQKYLSPPGRGNMLYFAPGVTDAQLRDFTLPLIITEGEFKTLAMWRLANWNNVEFPPLFPLESPAFTTGAARSGRQTGLMASDWM